MSRISKVCMYSFTSSNKQIGRVVYRSEEVEQRVSGFHNSVVNILPTLRVHESIFPIGPYIRFDAF